MGVPKEALPPYILDCDLPEDGEQVLLSLCYGGPVCLDTCVVEPDEELGELYSLEKHGEFDDVAAWAYVPAV